MFKTKQDLNECKDDRYELKDKITELEFEIRRIHREKDWDIKERVINQTDNLEVRLVEKNLEIAKTKKENEMLNKAFDEIGFDVKDSKEMMSELIKALGQKSDVKIIK